MRRLTRQLLLFVGLFGLLLLLLLQRAEMMMMMVVVVLMMVSVFKWLFHVRCWQPIVGQTRSRLLPSSQRTMLLLMLLLLY